jgi:hypothetical protein
MPILNSTPVNASLQEYQAYVESTVHFDVICAVPKNNSEQIDYLAMTQGIAEYTRAKAKRDAMELVGS